MQLRPLSTCSIFLLICYRESTLRMFFSDGEQSFLPRERESPRLTPSLFRLSARSPLEGTPNTSSDRAPPQPGRPHRVVSLRLLCPTVTGTRRPARAHGPGLSTPVLLGAAFHRLPSVSAGARSRWARCAARRRSRPRTQSPSTSRTSHSSKSSVRRPQRHHQQTSATEDSSGAKRRERARREAGARDGPPPRIDRQCGTSTPICCVVARAAICATSPPNRC
jgi:hypothetical protein